MATYKIPQDVEAEDKLLGPFTLRQFIYIIIVFISGWLSFLLARNSITLVFLPLTITPALFFGLLVVLGVKNSAQPAESYLASLVRFYFKPHKRIWNQEGVMENVRITAPKSVELHQSDNLSTGEVRSRLKQLATTMDSRGWSSKDPRFQTNIVIPTQSVIEGDRLISLSQLPGQLAPLEIHPQDDVMDESASPIAAHFDKMIKDQQKHVIDDAVAHMNDPSFNPYPQMTQRVIQPVDDDSIQGSVSRNKAGNKKTRPKKTEANHIPKYQFQDSSAAASAPDPAITNLVNNASDLSVQTLATEAQRLKSLESGDEISLH
ncbi:MAG TPA: PrgI family protein [Candidatus Saccharimonadales bacterium]